MKILASFGMLAIVCVWAALAYYFFPHVIMGTAGIAYLISLIYIFRYRGEN